jgi:hypothetical protein
VGRTKERSRERTSNEKEKGEMNKQRRKESMYRGSAVKNTEEIEQVLILFADQF